MDPKTIAYCRAVIANGAIDSTRRYNCTLVRANVGDYTLTVGEGGVSEGLGMPTLTPITGAAGGAGTGVASTVHSTGATTKQIRFFDDAGAAVDPAGFLFELRRYPASLPDVTP